MIDYVKSYEFLSMLALFTYWIPGGICLAVYFFRVVNLYRDDLKKCHQEYYAPELTLGRIVWLVVCAIMPAVNIIALVFDCAGCVFTWLGKVLNIPLVRKREKK